MLYPLWWVNHSFVNISRPNDAKALTDCQLPPKPRLGHRQFLPGPKAYLWPRCVPCSQVIVRQFDKKLWNWHLLASLHQRRRAPFVTLVKSSVLRFLENPLSNFQCFECRRMKTMRNVMYGMTAVHILSINTGAIL